MPTPLTVKVDLGIAELIKKLDEINQRRHGRTEAFFLNIRDDLESVATIIDGLDNLFVDLARGYSDRHLVDSSELLGDHVKATQDYLYGRNLVPKLIGLQGFITQAANDHRLRSKSGAPEKLSNVADRIQTYLTSINYTGPSGTGYEDLIELKGMAEKKLQGNALANEIISKANEALRLHPFKLRRSTNAEDCPRADRHGFDLIDGGIVSQYLFRMASCTVGVAKHFVGPGHGVMAAALQLGQLHSDRQIPGLYDINGPSRALPTQALRRRELCCCALRRFIAGRVACNRR
jgi:hypothetical protein